MNRSLLTPTREELSGRIAADLREKEEGFELKALDEYPAGFGGKLYLVLLDDKTHPSIRGGRSLWGVTRDVSYKPSNGTDVIVVPPGFVTDLASIPRPFWTLLPPDGPWVKAAVIHDFLYYTDGTGVWKKHPKMITRAAPYTRAEADWILRDAMRDRGVDVFRRNLIWLAVRIGGRFGWGR